MHVLMAGQIALHSAFGIVWQQLIPVIFHPAYNECHTGYMEVYRTISSLQVDSDFDAGLRKQVTLALQDRSALADLVDRALCRRGAKIILIDAR